MLCCKGESSNSKFSLLRIYISRSSTQSGSHYSSEVVGKGAGRAHLGDASGRVARVVVAARQRGRQRVPQRRQLL